ncbi:DNA polymerase III subunit delta' [Heliobacterium gestii]|uniref:DNA polymerase III subunit delta n=1 Tax=Heliomicrobium gestii TaxID=2699 RepID=A0A845L9H2_HELGE|nr:DNA polymerase III subunit delta' [Heliomicrobium gestii]MBM7866357.1 DNA polymerase-3 subunit delta' [Heliomicrobium gestii]MZP42858.1 DNA polymerase III subunit delta' [Heliomicrobium gestii]
MRLSQYVGQERAVRQLVRGLSGDRVAHAYLFSGPQGVGKKTVARAFAQSVLCLEPSEGDACEACPACRQAQGGSHPDLFHLAPDGATLKIDQIRNLQKRIRYRPYLSAHQVVLLEQAETMQGPSANALLKILEEPPGPTVFILITDRGHGILPTIRSRCLPVHFQPAPSGEIARFLQQKGVPAGHVPLLTLLADGRWDRAAKLAAEGLPAGREKARQLLDSLVQTGDSRIFQVAEEWDKDKEGIAEFFDYLALLLRDRLLIAGAGGAEVPVINGDIAGDAHGWPLPVLLNALDMVMAARRLLDTNASARLLVEDTLLKLRDLARGESLTPSTAARR